MNPRSRHNRTRRQTTNGTRNIDDEMSIGSETYEENNWLLVQVEGISAVLGKKLEEKDDFVGNGWDMISLANSVCTADSILEAKGTLRDVDSLYLRNQPSTPCRCLGDQQGEGEETGSSISDSFPTASKSIHTEHNKELFPLKEDTNFKSCPGDEGEFMNPKQKKKNTTEASKNDRERKMKKAKKKEKKKRETERKKRMALESFFSSDSEDDGSVIYSY